MKRTFLLEDHDEALKLWRRLGFKAMDLVHVDAHMDYAVPPGRPVEAVLNEATSVRELKEKLEYSLAFQRYQKDLSQQTNIGNYIHAAMEEGIVRDFFWVVPGSAAEFSRSRRTIKAVLRSVVRAKNSKAKVEFGPRCRGSLTTTLDDRRFVACVLEALPEMAGPVLLDIDADFLAFPSIVKADPALQIGRGKPWMAARELVEALLARVRPACATVAYSTRGGWTPMRLRHLGDEVAFHLAPVGFRSRWEQAKAAALHFSRFLKSGSARDYRLAAGKDPEYGGWDNNDGPLYLERRKFAKAGAEFRRILRVDRGHAGALWGMGVLAERRKDRPASLRWFRSARRASKARSVFRPQAQRLMRSFAEAQFNAGNLKTAGEMLESCERASPLDPGPRYLLGRLAELDRRREDAAACYRQAVQLGFDDEKPLLGLLRLGREAGGENDIISFVRRKRVALRRSIRAMVRRSGVKPGRTGAGQGLARLRKVLARLDAGLERWKA